MESLAYIHIALEYEKALQAECNSSEFDCQEQSTNTKAKVNCWKNWWPINLFSRLTQRQNSKVVHH
jgi:hypothetical protein